tara:strand:- start:58 stop:393 length:336 start_codon:yes stop_codon:yes gene_type:complete
LVFSIFGDFIDSPYVVLGTEVVSILVLTILPFDMMVPGSRGDVTPPLVAPYMFSLSIMLDYKPTLCSYVIAPPDTCDILAESFSEISSLCYAYPTAKYLSSNPICNIILYI